MKFTTSIVLLCLLLVPAASAEELFQVEKTEITLNTNGKAVAVKIHALQGPVIIHDVFADNTPTGDDGLCDNDGGFPVTCFDSAFALIRAQVNGSDLRPGTMPECLAQNDKLAMRSIVEEELGADGGIPLEKGDTLTLLFKTYGSGNKVRVGITVGYTGGVGDLQLWSEGGGSFDPCEDEDDCCGRGEGAF